MQLLDLTSTTSLLISTLLLLSVLWSRRREAGAQRAAKQVEFLDTVVAWPPQAVRVMTLPERQSFELLRRAVPRYHMVLAQVPLSRFISVPTANPHIQWLNRAGRLSVDLLVCDSSSRVVAAIEVRSTDESKRSLHRHERLAKVLKAANVPVHVWQDAALPTLRDVRQLFLASTRDEASVLPDSDDRRLLPQPEIHEMLADGDEYHLNHRHEPVSSGFFDDLDISQRAQAHA
jgi:Protein of unknown function (DUF2726)